MTRCDQDSPQVSSWDQDWSECRHVFNLASERWSMEVIWVYLQMFVNFLWTYLLMCWFKSLTLPPTIIGVKERWPQEVATFHLHDWWRRRMMFAIPLILAIASASFLRFNKQYVCHKVAPRLPPFLHVFACTNGKNMAHKNHFPPKASIMGQARNSGR